MFGGIRNGRRGGAANDRKAAVLRGAHVRDVLRATLDNSSTSVDRLRELAPAGYVNDHIRQMVWPVLLGVDVESEADKSFAPAIVEHKYYAQVNKDIERSMFHFDVTKSYDKAMRRRSRESLARIIHTMFTVHTDLHYIQGYHDVCSVILLVMGDERMAYYLIERMSLLHIRDSLRPSLDTVVQVLNLIFPLIKLVDPDVSAFLDETQIQSYPMFSLPWVLTWFSHNVERLEDVARIFDFLLARHPLMIMYFATAMILSLKDQLLLLPHDYPSVHQFFQTLQQDFDIDALIQSSQALFDMAPPHTLYAAEKVSFPSDSPLFVRDARDLPALLTDAITRSRVRHRAASDAQNREPAPPNVGLGAIIHSGAPAILSPSSTIPTTTSSSSPVSSSDSKRNGISADDDDDNFSFTRGGGMGGDDGIPVTYWGTLPPLPQTVKERRIAYHARQEREAAAEAAATRQRRTNIVALIGVPVVAVLLFVVARKIVSS